VLFVLWWVLVGVLGWFEGLWVVVVDGELIGLGIVDIIWWVWLYVVGGEMIVLIGVFGVMMFCEGIVE